MSDNDDDDDTPLVLPGSAAPVVTTTTAVSDPAIALLHVAAARTRTIDSNTKAIATSTEAIASISDQTLRQVHGLNEMAAKQEARQKKFSEGLRIVGGELLSMRTEQNRTVKQVSELGTKVDSVESKVDHSAGKLDLILQDVQASKRIAEARELATIEERVVEKKTTLELNAERQKALIEVGKLDALDAADRKKHRREVAKDALAIVAKVVAVIAAAILAGIGGHQLLK